MDQLDTVTAFLGERLLASGSRRDVALAAKSALDKDSFASILFFEDATGRQVDFDLRGTDDEVAARLEPAPPGRKGPGRPKLGVVAREITLLPRHWDWLAGQPGGASVVLRQLVDEARNVRSRRDRVRDAQQVADRFMLAMLGNQPDFEEASRALYAGNRERFEALTETWPADLRDHARRVAAPVFAADSS